jgi:oligo-1,6-glucosidase
MKKFLQYGICILVIILTSLSGKSPGNNPTTRKSADRKWWKEVVVYQIYPRSFKDGDGDGIGDLKGIISRLDYIKRLGIDVVWLNPVYSSPNDDNGYDISDYRNIMKDFGTMADFDSLLTGMHKRKIKLVMDLVVNHTSDEHRWFKQSRSSRNSPYRNYYHWWNAEKGKPNPRYSSFDVNRNAWKYDSLTNSYYLHYFSQKQPDLNWENPQVRQEVYEIMKFWLDKGIDGFRMDAFQFVAKDTTFPALPEGYERNIIKYYGMGPHIHDYLQEMNREVISKYDIMTVAEGAGTTFEDAHLLVDPERHELNMAYHFEGMDIGNDPKGYSLSDFKNVYTRWDSAFAKNGWISIFLGNHDVPRMVSKFGNDSPGFREVSSKMLTTFIMTMKGTPYYYNGDELGMDNVKFDKMEDYRDIATINGHTNIKNTGGNLKQFMEIQKFISRDNARTPFQWDTTVNAGFTTGTSWIKVNPNYKTVNAATEEKDPNSCLNYFRKIIKLRKDNLILVYGRYSLLDRDNPDVYAFTRELDGKKILVLLNFKSTTVKANTGLDISKAKVLLGNYSAPSKDGILQPYEAVIYRLQ